MGIIFREKGNFGGEFSWGNFALGGLDRISCRNSFYVSYFLFSYSIFHVEMTTPGDFVWRKFSACLDFLNIISMEQWNFGAIGKTIRT